MLDDLLSPLSAVWICQSTVLTSPFYFSTAPFRTNWFQGNLLRLDRAFPHGKVLQHFPGSPPKPSLSQLSVLLHQEFLIWPTLHASVPLTYVLSSWSLLKSSTCLCARFTQWIVFRAAMSNTAVTRLSSMQNVDPGKRRGRADPVCAVHLNHHLHLHPPTSVIPSPCELTADTQSDWSPGTALCFLVASGISATPLFLLTSIRQLKQLV